jgi:plastocyanin
VITTHAVEMKHVLQILFELTSDLCCLKRLQRNHQLSTTITKMKTTNLITAAVVSAGLTFGLAAQANEREHEEQTISSSNVPAAVQQAAQAEAKGGTIVRWEKEGSNYEAVVEKDGKQTGIEMDANGKVVNRHDEAKEHKGKSEKGEKH